MQKLGILFLGGAKRVSLAERFFKAGKKLGLETKVFSYELDKKVPFSVVGDVIIGKLWNDESIYDDMISIIDKKNISIVLANVDPATVVLAKLNEKFSELGLITSSTHACKIFLDKQKMNEHCVNEGIKTIPLSNDDYPILIKPRRGSASKGIYIIKDKIYQDYILSQIDINKYVAQKYINGIEYTVDAYVSRNGNFIGAVPRIRTSVTSGESTTATIINDDEIIEQTKLILAKFNLIGPLTLQFIRSENGLFFLELNPRFGGGVIASIEAGFNIPNIMLKDFLGEKIKPQKKYKQLIMTRYYREVFHAVDN